MQTLNLYQIGNLGFVFKQVLVVVDLPRYLSSGGCCFFCSGFVLEAEEKGILYGALRQSHYSFLTRRASVPS